MEDAAFQLTVAMLSVLFELLVPQSLDLASRDVVFTILVTGVVLLWRWLRERTSPPATVMEDLRVVL